MDRMTEESRGDRPHGPAPATDPLPPTADRPAAGHETRDISIRAIVGFGLALAVLTGIVLAAMWGVFRVFERRENQRDQPLPPMIAANLRRTPSGPRLEPDPLAPRRRLRAQESAVLTTAGWVDRDHGVVRIPIDRAMELLVEKGLPVPKLVTPAATPAPADRKARAAPPAGKAATP
jgi:hypothetical protein